MKYRLIAMDMDNTLLNHDKEITPRTAAALHAAAAAGCEVVFATGRSYIETKKYIDAFPEVRFFIGNTGTSIANVHTGELIYSTPFGQPLSDRIAEAIRDLDCLLTLHMGNDLYLGSWVRPYIDKYGCSCYDVLFNETGTWVPELFDLVEGHGDEMYKFDLFFSNHDEQKRGLEKLKDIPVATSGGTPNNIEITPVGSSKGNALKILCETLGIPMKEAIACGDADNDMSMVSAAGLGVAMGNATQPLKDIASVVTADCDNDGIADIIEKYIL